MKTYFVTYIVEVEIDIDDDVINAVNEEWRSKFYNLKTKNDIIDYITRNLLGKTPLNKLDGWADKSNIQALITFNDWYVDSITEIKREEGNIRMIK